MADYVLIQSRDPFESRDVASYYNLAADLVREGKEVLLFLVENGVLAARRGARPEDLAAIARNGVRVLADEFSLRERGIAPDRVADNVRLSSLDVVVDELAGGAKTLWH